MIWPFKATKKPEVEVIPDFYLYPFGSFVAYGSRIPINQPHPDSKQPAVFRKRALAMAEDIAETGIEPLKLHFKYCKRADPKLAYCAEMAFLSSTTPKEVIEKTRKYLNV